MLHSMSQSCNHGFGAVDPFRSAPVLVGHLKGFLPRPNELFDARFLLIDEQVFATGPNGTQEDPGQLVNSIGTKSRRKRRSRHGASRRVAPDL